MNSFTKPEWGFVLSQDCPKRGQSGLWNMGAAVQWPSRCRRNWYTFQNRRHRGQTTWCRNIEATSKDLRNLDKTITQSLKRDNNPKNSIKLNTQGIKKIKIFLQKLLQSIPKMVTKGLSQFQRKSGWSWKVRHDHRSQQTWPGSSR